jgi:hypothetical protein
MACRFYEYRNSGPLLSTANYILYRFWSFCTYRVLKLENYQLVT